MRKTHAKCYSQCQHMYNKGSKVGGSDFYFVTGLPKCLPRVSFSIYLFIYIIILAGPIL